MKHLIIAAGLSLIAAPALAGSIHDVPMPKSAKITTINEAQFGGDRFDPNSARDVRNANMRRASQDRSHNGRSAWSGLPHYY
jgi:hypothetical protein